MVFEKEKLDFLLFLSNFIIKNFFEKEPIFLIVLLICIQSFMSKKLVKEQKDVYNPKRRAFNLMDDNKFLTKEESLEFISLFYRLFSKEFDEELEDEYYDKLLNLENRKLVVKAEGIKGSDVKKLLNKNFEPEDSHEKKKIKLGQNSKKSEKTNKNLKFSKKKNEKSFGSSSQNSSFENKTGNRYI